jgi:uncharacterized membrane protein YfcA
VISLPAGLAFLVAGLIKGALGIGLPTVVMGLLSLFMPPAEAAALLVVPAIGTNMWQMSAGPALGALLRRFATMIAAIFVGTFLTIGLLTRTGAAAAAILGAVLAAYGVYGLTARRFHVPRSAERWASPLVGLVTGMLTGATGVYVIPTVPYLTSLALDREEFVQAIGIAAFVCPLALGLALAAQGEFPAQVATTSLLALVPALAGMYVGQRLRRRLPGATFMRAFFIGLVVLGGYTFIRTW